MFYMRIENNTYHPTKGSLADSWLSFLTRWGVLSLTERTEFTEVFCALFEPMRRWPLPRPLPHREGSSM